MLSGCASTGMARTLDPGQFQFSVSPSAQISVGSSGLGNNVPAPQLELGARYGVTERIDVGAKVYFPGVEADVRFGLLRAPSLQSGVDLTLAPSVDYLPFLSTNTPWIVSLPLLVGLNFNGSQLTLGPRVSYLLPSENRESGNTFLVGTSVGYAVPLNPSIRFITELSVLAAPASLGSDGVLCRAGIGFTFGGYAEE
ncbi:Hypothetical protein AA314_01117 [Archangium gephyra]|uniref:Outer membrane protein beta-barrel domain-containing protein n=1 Tax=Archangium gephyra TaxID=48 RepID=A0AAC8TCL0_9BACT|nr:Hypothetical protein AA314_01117 [Archangium gephyra]